MVIRKLLTSVGLLLLMGASSAHDYAIGQVWSYHVRPGDEGSLLQINKIEQIPKIGTIFHISIFDLRVPNAKTAGAIITVLPHLPVSRETLDKSVVALMPNPAQQVEYEEGYSVWKRAFQAGHAGIYTMSVAEIVSSLELIVARSEQ